jgi:hypothetical protein
VNELETLAGGRRGTFWIRISGSTVSERIMGCMRMGNVSLARSSGVQSKASTALSCHGLGFVYPMYRL